MKRIKNILNVLIVTITVAIITITVVTYKSKTATAPAVTDTTTVAEPVPQTAYAVIPPCAASRQTWTVGKQVWSDVIHLPECNKRDFMNSDTSPQCCCKSSDTIRYYYNWIAVKKHATQMCPHPWRVPAKQDFDLLARSTTGKAPAYAWRHGGNVNFGAVVREEYGQYWSLTELNANSNDNGAYLLSCHADNLHTVADFKRIGRQVRCVRED